MRTNMKRPADIPVKLWRELEEARETAVYEQERKRERRAWDRWLRGKTRRLAVLERKVAKVVAARNAVLAEHAPPVVETVIKRGRKRRRRKK